jgi:dephospho-CoA kinase
LDKEFLFRTLLCPSASDDDEVPYETVEGLHRVFGFSPSDLFGPAPLSMSAAASASARFKLPARVDRNRLPAYVVYAHYLALLVLEATPQLEPKELPGEAAEFRRAVIDEYGSLNFVNVLLYIWSRGVPILPLNDSGGFHGACWRVHGRNIIVLKQRTSSSARWLHDLLHEYWHAAHDAHLEEHPVIEESELSATRRESPDEIAASRFAGDVMLNGRAEELVETCITQARGDIRFLKSVVPKVAAHASVSVGALANYVAFRLSLETQGFNWWGTATNLQEQLEELNPTPREHLLKNASMEGLNEIDRGLLLRALEPVGLGIAGPSGAGKTTIAEAIAAGLHWRYASFGDYVRTVAKSHGLDPTSRDVLDALGQELVAENVEHFCRSVLAYFGWESGEPVVIEGIRHKVVTEALRRILAPMDFRLIYLDVDKDIRHERLLERGTRKEEVVRIEQQSTEQAVTREIPEIADVKVSASKPVEDLVTEIVGWVHEGNGRKAA